MRLNPLLVLALAPALLAPAVACIEPRPHWDAYVKYFLQSDGRVVEFSQESRSTSEGQAYALFHALVANDRERFARILEWTQNNLAQGDLMRRLPAWRWGYREDRQWGVIDSNPATDADMWLAYVLLEAGRLWDRGDYRTLGLGLLTLIEQHAVVEVPGLGWSVTPGPWSHDRERDVWRLNPSYLPLQLLRRFAAERPEGPWESVIVSSLKLLGATTEAGVVPDWIEYDPKSGFIESEKGDDVSSYDAIRVYLWAGMLAEDEPLKARLMQLLKPGPCTGETPPERIYLRSRKSEGEGPVGFKAALLPYLHSQGNKRCLDRLRAQVDASWNNNLLNEEPLYYDQNLALFGLGWLDGQYRFDAQGRLHARWETKCDTSKKPS